MGFVAVCGNIAIATALPPSSFVYCIVNITLKSVVFSSSSSFPPLVSNGGGLVCESVGKADLLLDHFDSKQSREAVGLPLTCHPSPSLTTFVFRSSEVRRLLLDLDSYGGRPTGCVSSFSKENC